MTRSAGLVLISLLALGCQSVGMAPGVRDLPEEQFQSIWQVYSHCLASRDLKAVRDDADGLTRAAFANEGSHDSWPGTLAAWVEAPPVRLAVEPKAMAAACALHGGRIAWQAGHPEAAHRLYSLVVRRFHEPHLAFYVKEADEGLALVERNAATSHVTLVDAR